MPIYVAIDMSPTRIGWVINQEGKDGAHHAIKFAAYCKRERERGREREGGMYKTVLSLQL